MRMFGKLARMALGALAAMALAGPALAATQVDDFRLADQHLLARHLYKMQDAKAVVLITYAAGDAAIRAEAKGYMALKATYAPKGVEFLMLDSKLGDRREKVVADAKAAGLDMPILFDYQQLVGESLASAGPARSSSSTPGPGPSPIAARPRARPARGGRVRRWTASSPARRSPWRRRSRAAASLRSRKRRAPRASRRFPTPARSPRSSRPSAPPATSRAGSGPCRSPATSR
ncbi:MAG: hypothetical protein ABW360_06940 [Phenylobacterium sp.]